MSELNAEFAALFEKIGLTKQAIGKELRLSHTSVGRYLRGQLKPKQVTIDAMHRILEIRRMQQSGAPMAPSYAIREDEVPYIADLRALDPHERRVLKDMAAALRKQNADALGVSSPPATAAAVATERVVGPVVNRRLKDRAAKPRSETSAPDLRVQKVLGGRQ
jgi:predicted transcriptional regulator